VRNVGYVRNDGTTERRNTFLTFLTFLTFPTQTVHKTSNAAEVGGGVDLEGIAVAAPELDECLGRRSGLEQALPMRQRNHVISPGVQEKLGDPDPGDFVHRGKPAAPDPSHRDIRIELGASLDDRGERPLQNQPRGRHPAGQVNRNGRSQRVAEHDDPLRPDPQLTP
jgi:hypothetical protein